MEAEALVKALRESASRVLEADTDEGHTLKSSLENIRRLKQEENTEQDKYNASNRRYSHRYGRTARQARDVLGSLSLAGHPQACEELLRAAGIVPHKAAFQLAKSMRRLVSSESAPPARSTPASPEIGRSLASAIDVEPEQKEKPPKVAPRIVFSSVFTA